MSLAYSLSTHRLQGGLFIDQSLYSPLRHRSPLSFLSSLPLMGCYFWSRAAIISSASLWRKSHRDNSQTFKKVARLCGFISEAPLRPDAFPSWGTISAVTDYKGVTEMYPNFIRFPPRNMMCATRVFGYLFCLRLKRWMWVNVRALDSFITSSVHVPPIINPFCCVFLFVRISIHFKRCSKWWKWMSGSETWARLKPATWVSHSFRKSLEIRWHRIICKLTLSWCARALLAVCVGAKFVFASFLGPSPVFIYGLCFWPWAVKLSMTDTCWEDRTYGPLEH